MFNFFLDASRLLYSPNAGIMKSALSELKQESCLEISIIRGLLLTLAWDCKLRTKDVIANNNAEAVQHTLSGLARLLLMAPDILNDEEAHNQAHDAIVRLGSTYSRSPLRTLWLNEFIRWGNDIKSMSQNLRRLPAINDRPEVGDLVFPIKSATPQIYVVKDASQNRVTVIDVDSEGEKKVFGEKYVAIIQQLA
jgi:hypothetical protein